jgi:WD40 repeat protein
MPVDFSKVKPKLAWQLMFEGNWPTSVAFLADGRLAAGDQSGRILIWNIGEDPTKGIKPDPKNKELQAPSLVPERALVGHENGVTRLVASADGKRLYSASLDRTIRVWEVSGAKDASNAKEVTIEIVLDSETRERALRRGDKSLKDKPGVRVPTHEAAAVWKGHDDWVSSLALSRDGGRLISGDYGSRVIVWNTADGKEVARWSGRPWNWIVAAALNADGTAALVSEHRYKRDDFDVPAAAVRMFKVDGGAAASATETLDVLKVQFPKYDPLANTYDGAQVWRKFVAAGLVAAAFSPDDKTVALGQGGETEKGVVHLVSAGDGKLVRDVSGHQSGVTDVAFSADGRYVLSTGRDTALRITAVSDGKEALQLGAPRGGQFKDWLSSLALSADERWIAATDIAGLVHVWACEG